MAEVISYENLASSPPDRAVFLHEFPNPPIPQHRRHTDHAEMHTLTFPDKGKASLRRGRTTETGQIYLVTFGTHGRARLFSEWTFAHEFAKALTNRLLLRESRLHCWVLMPDHWHGLIEVGPLDQLSTLVGRIKGTTARCINQVRDDTGSIWAEGFHDHALRQEEDMLNIARYIILNPVRAGIVDRVGQYPFWDAIWLDDKQSPS